MQTDFNQIVSLCKGIISGNAQSHYGTRLWLLSTKWYSREEYTQLTPEQMNGLHLKWVQQQGNRSKTGSGGGWNGDKNKAKNGNRTLKSQIKALTSQVKTLAEFVTTAAGEEDKVLPMKEEDGPSKKKKKSSAGRKLMALKRKRIGGEKG